MSQSEAKNDTEMKDLGKPDGASEPEKRKRESPEKKVGKSRLGEGAVMSPNLPLSEDYQPFGPKAVMLASTMKPTKEAISNMAEGYQAYYETPTCNLAVPASTSTPPSNTNDVGAAGFTYTPGVTNVLICNTSKPEGFESMDASEKTEVFTLAVKKLATFGITIANYDQWKQISSSKQEFDKYISSLPQIANVQSIVIGHIKQAADIYTALEEYSAETNLNIADHIIDIANPTSLLYVPGLAFGACKQVPNTGIFDEPVDVHMMVSRNLPTPSRDIAITKLAAHSITTVQFKQPFIGCSEALLDESLYSHDATARNRLLAYYVAGIDLRKTKDRSSVTEHLNIQNSLVDVIRVSGIQSHAQIAQVAKSLLRDYSLMIIPFYDSDSPFGQAVGSTPSATSVYNARLCGERQIASSNDKLPRTTPYSNLMALHAKLDRIDKRGFTANFFVLVPSDRANLGRLFHAGDPVFSNHIDLIPGKTTICINNDRGYRGEAGPQLLFLAAPSGLQKMTLLNRENHLRQIEKKVLEGCVTAAFPKALIESINHPCEAFIGRVIGENGGGTRVVGVRIHANDPRMVAQLRERFAQQNVREELEVSMQNQYKAFYDPSSIVAETSIFANKDRDERFRLVKNLQDLVYQTDDPNLSSAIAISGSKFVHISSNMVMIRSRGCNNLPIEEMLAVVRETA